MRSLISLIQDDQISSKGAKDIFERIWESGGDPLKVIDELGLRQVQDTVAIEKAVDLVFSENTEQAEKISTNPKLVGWFVGQAMKASKGKANPKMVTQMVTKKLEA